MFLYFFRALFTEKVVGVVECDTQRGVTEIAWTGCGKFEIPDVHWV